MSTIASTGPVPNWLRLAPGLLLVAAILLLFRDTAVAMVTIWNRSETFAHAFLVPPIVLWLVWRRRAELATLPVRPAPWVLLPMAAVCAVWLLGELASVNAATQLALVTLLVMSVPAMFGLRIAHALLFPLLFLYFAAPVGEFMVPQMMEWTADFTVAALQFSRVPVYREGLQFVIPTGNWSVVEACSGVRYLIASFMVGTLFAYLNYRSPTRRAVFMLVSLAVPIVANWLRAYLIVMIGHLSGNQLAAGVDHIIYGWVFFGVVIGAMFMIGARWAEPDEPAPASTVPADAGAGAGVRADAAVAPSPAASTWVVGVLALMLLAGTQALVWQLDRPRGGPPPVVALPPAAAGTAAAPAAFSAWVPNFNNASSNTSSVYAGAAGEPPLGLWVAYYRDQGYERKMVSSINSLTDLTPESKWAQIASGTQQLGAAAGGMVWRTGTVRGASTAGAADAQRLRVWSAYWVGGRWTTSDARAKVLLALDRLFGRGDDAAAVFFYTPVGDKPAEADARLALFVEKQLQGLSAQLVATREAR